VRFRIALVLTLALLTAVPAEAARDVVVRDSPRAAVATCLRSAGAPGFAGLLAPLERRMSPYDLMRVTAGGVTVAATARLGVLDECSAVAADPSGHAIVAGAARTRRLRGAIRAALAEPGGGFGAPVDIARTESSSTRVVTAVSPRGDAVVAWALTRPVRGRRYAVRTRVVAAVRPAGAAFGRPQFLTRWRRSSFPSGTTVSAGMDSAGTATVAWAQPIPDRGSISSLYGVEAAASTSGGAFGPPQVMARPVQDVERVALAVAPDGRALLAHDGQEMVQVYERAAGEPAFARVRRLRSRRDAWQHPDLAMAPDGSAVVAWRGNEAAGSEDVFVASRRGTGPWTSPAAVQRRREDRSFTVEFLFSSGGDRPSPPHDGDNTGVGTAIAPDGRYLVGWGVERRLAFGDRLLAARMVHGQAGGAPSRAESAGCRCRAVNGMAPLALGGGELLLAYTDNVTRTLSLGIDMASRLGRLHLAEPGPPGMGPEPPRLTVRAPRARTLGFGNALRLGIGCDRPCDLRAYVVDGRGRGRGVAVTTLPQAGTVRLAIKPSSDEHLAPPAGGRSRIVVHGFAPNGRAFATRAVPIDLRRKPVRPLPRLVDVRAVRQGRSVVVTWGTDRPARRIRFEVARQLSRRRVLPEVESLLGRGRRRFRVRLEGAADSVSVSVIRNRPPFDRRTRVVPVSG